MKRSKIKDHESKIEKEEKPVARGLWRVVKIYKLQATGYKPFFQPATCNLQNLQSALYSLRAALSLPYQKGGEHKIRPYIQPAIALNLQSSIFNLEFGVSP